MKKIFFILLILIVYVCNNPIVASNPQPYAPYMPTGLNFIAHRGVHYRGIAPENSLDAYILAARAGFKYVETDIMSTKDSVLVVMHDQTVNRTMRNKSDYSEIKNPVNIQKTSFDELRNNYVFCAKSPYMRRPIPSFKAFLEVCRQYGLHPIIELKPCVTIPEATKAYQMAHAMLGDTHFSMTSFRNDLLDHVRILSRKVRLYYISCTDVSKMVAVGNASTYPYFGVITPKLVQQCRENNVELSCWTVPCNKFNELRQLGVNTMASNDLAPNIENRAALWSASIDVNRVENWLLENKKLNALQLIDGDLNLKDGQELKMQPYGSKIGFGGYGLNIQFEGKIKIESNNHSITVSSKEVQTNTYSTQGLLVDESAFCKITAVGPTVIHSLSYNAVQY